MQSARANSSAAAGKSHWARLASRAKTPGDDHTDDVYGAIMNVLGHVHDDQEAWPETLPDFVGMKFLERDGSDDYGKGACLVRLNARARVFVGVSLRVCLSASVSVSVSVCVGVSLRASVSVSVSVSVVILESFAKSPSTPFFLFPPPHCRFFFPSFPPFFFSFFLFLESLIVLLPGSLAFIRPGRQAANPAWV